MNICTIDMDVDESYSVAWSIDSIGYAEGR